jgi:hypothetical protein
MPSIKKGLFFHGFSPFPFTLFFKSNAF